MAGQAVVLLREPERVAGRDPQLIGDEVTTGDEFRDGVFDLESRVHLEEGGRAVGIDEELARARADIPDRARQPDRGRAKGPARLRIHRWRRGFLQHLLVAPLGRTVAFAEVDAVPMGIEQDLDLDVPGALDQSLEDDPLVTERGACLPTGSGELRRRTDPGRARCACPCRRRRPPA